MSGGMKQRVVGAIASSCEPHILIADEPTTALDATIQAQYLRLLKDIQRESGLSIIFITHDFGIVATMCDQVAVMYGGRIVEYGPAGHLQHPGAPYTRALLSSVPASTVPSIASTRSPAIPPALGSASGVQVRPAMPVGGAALPEGVPAGAPRAKRRRNDSHRELLEARRLRMGQRRMLKIEG